MRPKNKISIVTACLNAEKYISEAIESVIHQRGDFEIEYIVMDGQSTDRTMSIIESYKRLIDSKKNFLKCRGLTFRYLSEKDSGMYDALSKGFKLATGNILAYLNYDDYYLPNAFSTVSAIFNKFSEIQWLTGMPVIYNEDGQIIHWMFPFKYDSSLIRTNMYGKVVPFLQQESTFWTSALMKYIDTYELGKFKYAGDYYLWNRFSRHTHIFFVQSILGGFRDHTGQLSDNKSEYLKEMNAISERTSIRNLIKGFSSVMINKYFPYRIRKFFNTNYIYYHAGEWRKYEGLFASF